MKHEPGPPSIVDALPRRDASREYADDMPAANSLRTNDATSVKPSESFTSSVGGEPSREAVRFYDVLLALPDFDFPRNAHIMLTEKFAALRSEAAQPVKDTVQDTVKDMSITRPRTADAKDDKRLTDVAEEAWEVLSQEDVGGGLDNPDGKRALDALRTALYRLPPVLHPPRSRHPRRERDQAGADGATLKEVAGSTPAGVSTVASVRAEEGERGADPAETGATPGGPAGRAPTISTPNARPVRCTAHDEGRSCRLCAGHDGMHQRGNFEWSDEAAPTPGPAVHRYEDANPHWPLGAPSDPTARTRKAIVRIAELVGVPGAGGPERVVAAVAELVSGIYGEQASGEGRDEGGPVGADPVLDTVPADTRSQTRTFEAKLRELCAGAILNHCPNEPPCTGDEDSRPLEHKEWCAVCMLVTDIHALLSSGAAKGEQ